MKIIKVENKHYIRLGDLDHLLRLMSNEIYDRYDMGEDGILVQKNGKKGLTLRDHERLKTISEVMTRVMESRIDACETDEEFRKLHEQIENEFYLDKYVIVSKYEDEDGKKHTLLFRKYCEGAMRARMKAEGKSDEEIREELRDHDGDPVFTEQAMEAKYFENHEFAESTARYISQVYGVDLKVEPAWYYNYKAVKKMLDAIFSEPEEEEEEDGENG